MKKYISKSSLIFAILSVGFSSASWTDEIKEREQAARQATGQFLKQLGGALKKEMGSKGPESAISVCRDVAPQLAGELSRAHGWRVTRVSEKARNPMLGMPDAWELKVLNDFKVRAIQGEKYSDITFSEVTEEGGTRYFRFMKPIGTKPMCLTCHGDGKQIPENVQARLNTDYPLDTATDYQPGDLRGAVSIKQPMDIPLRDVAQSK